MNTLLLDIILPGGRRPVRPDLGQRVGIRDNDQVTDTVQDSGNAVLDTLNQAGDQVADTLAQGQALLMDSGVGGSSSTAVWTVVIAVVALIVCISLAVAYRRRTMAVGA